MSKKRCFLILSAAMATALCLVAGPADAKLPVMVSILPQQYFVEQIGKELVDVRVMVPPGAGPETYAPKPRQMAALAGVKIFFAIGVPFENAWLDKIAATNPGMEVVRSDRDIEKLPTASHHHEAGAAADASDAPDPHIWLSPPLVMIQARTVLAALQRADAANAATYAKNHAAFASELERLDAELRRIFDGKRGMRFMVFHPSWGYFAHAYGLEQVPIEIEGKEPKPGRLKDLITQARGLGIKTVFVQPQHSSKSAEMIAREIGARVVQADPLAPDWPENLLRVALRIQEALR